MQCCHATSSILLVYPSCTKMLNSTGHLRRQGGPRLSAHLFPTAVTLLDGYVSPSIAVRNRKDTYPLATFLERLQDTVDSFVFSIFGITPTDYLVMKRHFAVLKTLFINARIWKFLCFPLHLLKMHIFRPSFRN